MDNSAILTVVKRIPSIRTKFLGSFPPTHMFQELPENTFQIVNTNSGLGVHWIVIVNKDNVYYFGDSMGRTLNQYPELKVADGIRKTIIYITTQSIQKTRLICGMFSVYMAFLVFAQLPNIPINRKIQYISGLQWDLYFKHQLNEWELFRFLHLYKSL